MSLQIRVSLIPALARVQTGALLCAAPGSHHLSFGWSFQQSHAAHKQKGLGRGSENSAVAPSSIWRNYETCLISKRLFYTFSNCQDGRKC